MLYSFLGVHLEVNLLSYYQLVAWLLGDVDGALQMSEEGLTLAHQVKHPYSLDYALAFAAIPRLLCRQTTVAKARVETAIELSKEYGFAQWKAHEVILQGRAFVEDRRVGEGIEKMRQGLQLWQNTGAKLAKSYYLGLMVEAHIIAGQASQGLLVLDEALAHVETYSEHCGRQSCTG